MKITQLRKFALVQSILSKKEKVIISGLCLWSFIHTYIIIKNNSGFGSFVAEGGIRLLLIDREPKMINPTEYFYPFTIFEGNYVNISNFDLRLYDYTEYFFYVVGAWLIYFLYRFLKK